MARQRRSFPIKISTNYAKRDVAEAVLIDLVHKHPRGPNGTLTKHDYRSWGTDPALDDADGTICGYQPLDLYRMVMNLKEVTDPNPTGEWDYRHLVRTMFPDCGDRGVTRRSRRFADRLGRAVQHIMRKGLPGIWKVNWGYDSTECAMMHANSEEDATIQAKMFFGPMMSEHRGWVNATFVREGSPLELLNANKGMIDGFDRLVARQLEEIEKIKERIEKYEAGKQFVEMYALNCMQAGTDVEDAV